LNSLYKNITLNKLSLKNFLAKTKLFQIIIFSFIFNNVYSQNVLQNIALELNLREKNIELHQAYSNESLLGKHISYSCYYNDIELKDFYVKVHLDKYGEVFLLQENISEIDKIEISEFSLKKEKIERSLKENYKIIDSKSIYVKQSEGYFQKAIEVIVINEKKDIYLERVYFSETDFSERNLKVHFVPIDTTIQGSVFLPDPLTSAGEEYGNNFQDSYKKDTVALIVKTIPNTGQSSIITGVVPYTYYSETFNVSNQSVSNSFSGTNIFYVIKELFLNVNNNVLGYNAELVDDISNYKTKLIKEDYDYVELNAEQFQIEVRGDFSASIFSLKNNLFEITDFSLPAIVPYSSAINDFTFNRSNKAFEEINIFYHINSFQNYIAELGYGSLHSQKVIIDAHGNSGADNSFFTNTPSPRLIFGDGGVDDGEDASVVIHEYTHALSNFASPNTNIGAERQAIDEALGDYFSSSYYSDFNDFTKGQVFPWDGHNEFWNGRLSNSDSTYESLDLSKTIYINAEILSATLMDVFEVLGKETTDKLVLETMFLNVSNNTFQDVANNLLLIDSLLFNNVHKCDIYNVLSKRKFKEGFCIGKKVVNNLYIHINIY